MAEYQYDKDTDGIVTVTFDAEGKTANTMTVAWLDGMFEVLERLQSETDLTGVVLASAKKTFFAGGDLESMIDLHMNTEELFDYAERNKKPFRMMEQMAVPFVAAINGAALGGGYEVCLGCNHRIVVNDPKAVVGMPEVTLGLLPGAGGVVRTTAMIGLEKALPLIAEGKQLRPQDALKAGLVDAIVESEDELIPAAKAWIKANPQGGTQPWDKKGFEYPGGNADSAHVRMVAAMAPTMLYNKTRGLMPAPERAVDAAVNSMRMGFDSALRAESRGLVALIESKEAKAAISTFFFGMQTIKSGKIRPEGPPNFCKKSAVLGAGMMGAGIAWANALKGLPTVLKDLSKESAEKGRAYSGVLADKRIQRKRMTEERKTALLDLITPTDADVDYQGVDIIIEAVFEEINLKEKVIGESFPQLADDGIYASNTSSLPISVLAEFCPDPSRFIGLHFFSPVDKMKIVEIICGEKTSETTLRKAYDYVAQIGYMPIVVNDSRGFFTSRVFATYIDEGLHLMQDGMSPVAIERSGWLAGMPVGPLAVHDEVSMELTKKAYHTHKELDQRLGQDSAFGKDNTATLDIGHAMVDRGRAGRKSGAGFYDYHEDGSKSLWPELDQFIVKQRDVSMDDAIDRLLYRQVVESLRCLDEGVLNTQVEANIGSIFAIGFPPHTGGVFQFIQGVGHEAFVKRATELADQFGERFKVEQSAVDKLARLHQKKAA